MGRGTWWSTVHKLQRVGCDWATNTFTFTFILGTELLLLSHFSHIWLCVTPQTAAHQTRPSLGFSRQEHWSGLPFPSPMHESEKWKWSRSVVSDPQRPHGLKPTRLLHPWDFPGRSTGVGCHCLWHELKPKQTSGRLTGLRPLWGSSQNCRLPSSCPAACTFTVQSSLKSSCGSGDRKWANNGFWPRGLKWSTLLSSARANSLSCFHQMRPLWEMN